MFGLKNANKRIATLQAELDKALGDRNKEIREKGELEAVNDTLRSIEEALNTQVDGLRQQLDNVTRRGAPVENVAIKTTGLVKVYDVLVGCDKGTGFYEDGVVDQRWLDVHKGQAGGYDLVLVKR